MSSATPPPPSPDERRPPFQFSMKTLMGTVTFVAVGLALLAVFPDWVGVLAASVVQVAFVTFIVAGAVFATGTYRTFCIGAVAVQFLTQGIAFSHWIFSRFYSLQTADAKWIAANLGINIAFVSLGGWFCILAQRFWKKRCQ